jgi:hypothetical protein
MRPADESMPSGVVWGGSLNRGGPQQAKALSDESLQAPEVSVTKADTELAEALLGLGRVNAGPVAYGWSNNPIAAHYALAIVRNYADDFALALRSADKAIVLGAGCEGA